MHKYRVKLLIRVALTAALMMSVASRASADSILLSNVQVHLDVATLSASITAGLTADSDEGGDVFLDALSVSLARDGVPIPDLFTGPTLLDDLPFFSLPLSLPDGGSLPATTLLFRLTGLFPGSSYTGSFSLFQFGADGTPLPLQATPQEIAFDATPVPEPGTLWLLATGACALAARRRRKRSLE